LEEGGGTRSQGLFAVLATQYCGTEYADAAPSPRTGEAGLDQDAAATGAGCGSCHGVQVDVLSDNPVQILGRGGSTDV